MKPLNLYPPQSSHFVNYPKAKEKARELMEIFDISELPVDLEGILQTLDVTVRPFSTLSEEVTRVFREESCDAVVSWVPDLKKYLIIYDNDKMRERIRFTLAHELGHILLDHVPKSGVLKRIHGRRDPIEVEANTFAAELLRSEYLLKILDASNQADIETLCDISPSAALIAEGKVSSLRLIEPITPGTPYDFYANQFKEFIHKIKYRLHCNVCNSDFSIKDARYCPICGTNDIGKYHYVWSVNAMTHSTGIPSDENQKALRCPRCLNEDTHRGDFCPVCGLNLINSCSHQLLDCPNTTPLSVNDRFCPYCGARSLFFINDAIKAHDYIPF